ncbi:hypothetical protein [Lysinibacillus fusiformis]|uniref:hypothetical protein n=1 Tax=Lysinibacillus fusiformis TaxID=28031 RepID=UPI0004688614|nr:hypothetical protein [Lysinibacillus fusiformis]
MSINNLIVNNPEITNDLDCKQFFVQTTPSQRNPIDQFYNVCTEYVKLTKPEIYSGYPDLSRLLLMGFVSAVEEYLRGIFSEVLSVCPMSKEHASEKMIKFGAIEYYSNSKIAIGLFDSSSFASSSEIIKRTKELLNVDVNSENSVKAALDEFEKVCHLRHCAIHGGGILNGHNAKELSLEKSYVNRLLRFDMTAIQECLSVCYSFVRAFNSFISKKIIGRLMGQVIKGYWDEERDLFKSLIDIFYSKIDIPNEINYKGIYRKISPLISFKDISENPQNKNAIKNILNSFRDLGSISDYGNNFQSLDVDEISCILGHFKLYDSEETKKILKYLLDNHTNEEIKLLVLDNDLLEISIEELKYIIKENLNFDIRLKAIGILINKYETNYGTLLSYLNNEAESDYLLQILNLYIDLENDLEEYIKSNFDEAFFLEEFVLSLEGTEIRVKLMVGDRELELKIDEDHNIKDIN